MTEKEITFAEAFSDLVEIIELPQAIFLGLLCLSIAIVLNGIFR